MITSGFYMLSWCTSEQNKKTHELPRLKNQRWQSVTGLSMDGEEYQIDPKLLSFLEAL